jgi:HEPN domain-containing protein
MSNPDDPASWVAKADSDLLCIDNNLNDAHVPWDAVCFHAQQAAEKMLKAFLVAQGMIIARTHNLPILLDECGKCGLPSDPLRADCQFLNAYAVTFRYPASTSDPTEVEGRAAVAAARRVYHAVRVALEPPHP